jgi:hypothetical protein
MVIDGIAKNLIWSNALSELKKWMENQEGDSQVGIAIRATLSFASNGMVHFRMRI